MVSLTNGTNLTDGNGAHDAHHGPFAGYFFCFALLCGILARQVGSTSWKVYADYNPTTSAYFACLRRGAGKLCARLWATGQKLNFLLKEEEGEEEEEGLFKANTVN